MRRLFGSSCLSLLAIFLAGCSQQSAPQPASGQAPVEEFSRKVQDYAELQQRLRGQLPALPDRAEAEQIVAHKQALRSLIQKARFGAKPGDLFVPSIRPGILGIVQAELQGAEGANTRKIILEDSLEKDEAPILFVPAVNKPYPDGVSISTVPPDMLRKLPALPEGLEYRFAGRHLLLLDISANLIADFISNALPRARAGK